MNRNGSLPAADASEEAKKTAKKLQKYLAEYGYQVKLGHAQQVAARMLGARNLQTLQGAQQGIATTDLVAASGGDIRKLFDSLICDAVAKRASAVNIEYGEAGHHQVRYRIDGDLRSSFTLTAGLAGALTRYAKQICGLDPAETTIPQAGRCSCQSLFSGRNIQVRIATLIAAAGEKVILTIIDASRVYDMENLGISNVEGWKELSGRDYGLVLVCGATGSGKTTTLYSTVKHMDAAGHLIYMIEDPIEHRLESVVQREVTHELRYPDLVKAALHHHADVVVIGEIRDAKTAELALDLVATGHLVYATLHCNSVVAAIERIRILSNNDRRADSALAGVLAQRLVKKCCTWCQGGGCDKCSGMGCLGRTLVTEFATFGGRLDQDGTLDGTRAYQTFHSDAWCKVREGVLRANEARIFGPEPLPA